MQRKSRNERLDLSKSTQVHSDPQDTTVTPFASGVAILTTIIFVIRPLMFRIALRQSLIATRFAQQRSAIPAVFRAPLIIGGRFESNQGATVREKQQYLQADWVAPKLTYEEVKKRTQEPTEVRLGSCTVSYIPCQCTSRMRT